MKHTDLRTPDNHAEKTARCFVVGMLALPGQYYIVTKPLIRTCNQPKNEQNFVCLIASPPKDTHRAGRPSKQFTCDISSVTCTMLAITALYQKLTHVRPGLRDGRNALPWGLTLCGTTAGYADARYEGAGASAVGRILRFAGAWDG